MHEKEFNDWMGEKSRLDQLVQEPPMIKQAQVWWCAVGENIGSEIDGKSAYFTRPVIILKKLSHGFYFVIPTTTKDKKGSWYVPFIHGGVEMNACLHQARAIDFRRLHSKLGMLDDQDFIRVKDGFISLYK